MQDTLLSLSRQQAVDDFLAGVDDAFGYPGLKKHRTFLTEAERRYALETFAARTTYCPRKGLSRHDREIAETLGVSVPKVAGFTKKFRSWISCRKGRCSWGDDIDPATLF